MYKTVRHGENSLQYTILPQQDDGAAATAANICGRNSSGIRRRARRGRTATILILTLILACGVIGAAVVVPLLISTDLVGLPSAFQRFSSNNNLHHHGGHHSHQHVGALHRNKTLQTSTTVHHNTTQASVTSTSEDNTIAAVSASASSTSVKAQKSNQFESTTIKPPPVPLSQLTLTTETGTRADLTTMQQQGMGVLLEEVGSANEHDHLGGSKKKALQEDLNVKNGTAMLVVSAGLTSNKSDETTTETKQDVVMVPMKPEEVTEHPKHRSWLEPRWPFADPSSYFQWTGYNGRDSLLLPLILGGAMLLLLIAICICYSIRRRRQKKLRRQTIGKISSDLQSGDKMTLLLDGSEEE